MDKLKAYTKRYWKQWNEFFMFFLGVLFFIISPSFYRLIDANAGSFNLGVLQAIPTGYLFAQFILVASWLSYKFTFPKLYKYLDDSLEKYTTEVSANWKQNVFSVVLYIFYCWVHIESFKMVM